MSFSILYSSKLTSSSVLPSWPWVAAQLVVLITSALYKPFPLDSGRELKIIPANPPIPPLTSTLTPTPTPTTHVPLRPTPTTLTQPSPSPLIGLSFMLLVVFVSFAFSLGVIWKSSKPIHGDVSSESTLPSGPNIPKKRNTNDSREAQAPDGAPPPPPPSPPDTQPTRPSEPNSPPESNPNDVPETQEPGGDPPPPPSPDTEVAPPNKKRSKRSWWWWFKLTMIILLWSFRKELVQGSLTYLFSPLKEGYSQLRAEIFRLFTAEWYLLFAFPLNFAIDSAISILLLIYHFVASLVRLLLFPFKVPVKVWKRLKPLPWWGRILSIAVCVALVVASINYTPWSQVILHCSICLDVAMTALAPVGQLFLLISFGIYAFLLYALWRPLCAVPSDNKRHILIALIIYRFSRYVLRQPTILKRVQALENELRQHKLFSRNSENEASSSPSLFVVQSEEGI